MRQLARLFLYILRNVLHGPGNLMLGVREAEFRRLERTGRITRGQGTYGWPQIFAFDRTDSGLRVGAYCSLNGAFVLGGKHAVDQVTTYPLRIHFGMEGAGHDGNPTHTGDTVLGSDVWTCAGALINSGVNVGHGAIVGAGAVVITDVPAYAIVGGNPARVIRYRFSPEQIAALLEICWWDWSEDRVRAAVPYLASADIDRFIAYAQDSQANSVEQNSGGGRPDLRNRIGP
jgi:chloramphenicol O-acetyltransferase type B